MGLAITTPMITVNRGEQAISELVVGDKLYDEQGYIATITSIGTPVAGNNCYEIVFSGGATVVADASHPWLISSRLDQYDPLNITTYEMWQVYERLHRVTFIPSIDRVAQQHLRHIILRVAQVTSVTTQKITVDSLTQLYCCSANKIPTL